MSYAATPYAPGFANRDDREPSMDRASIPVPDAGFVAQAVHQVRDIWGDVMELARRLESTNDRLIGPEPKDASTSANGANKPLSDVDALGQNILELRLAVARLHQQVVRNERL